MSIFCIGCGQTTDEDGICRLCSRHRERDQGVSLIVAGVLVAVLVVVVLARLWAGR